VRQTVNEPITQTTLKIRCFFSLHRLFIVKTRVVLPYISHILRYVPRQRVGFLRRFGLKTSIDFGYLAWNRV